MIGLSDSRAALGSDPNSEGTLIYRLFPTINPEQIHKRLSFLQFEAADLELLRACGDKLRSAPVEPAAAFHTRVMESPDLSQHLAGAVPGVAALSTLGDYIEGLLSGDYACSYVQSRLRIGLAHQRIGLDPGWYLAATGALFCEIVEGLAGPVIPKSAVSTLKGLLKLLAFDVGLAMDAYVQSDRAALTASVASLRKSEALLSEAQEVAQLGHWELTLPQGDLLCSPRAAEFLGLHCESPFTLSGYSRLRERVAAADRGEVDRAFSEALRTGEPYDVRYRIESPDRPIKLLRERGRAMPSSDDGECRIVGTIQDISVSEAQLSRIKHLALFDQLTGLPNRTSFYEALEKAIASVSTEGGSLSVLAIDLDRFKEINDASGHQAGDVALLEISSRLRTLVRRGEFIARIGGDEFSVLVPEGDDSTASRLAERLCEALSFEMRIGERTFRLGASIGISTYPRDGATAELLTRNADTAMYCAKRRHGGVERYVPRMSESVVRRVDLARRLDQALSRQILQVHFQPQVQLSTGRLAGAEALLRWEDELSGRVAPDEFIAVAEERSMMGALGDYVMDFCCRQLNAWRAARTLLPGRLALNVSPRQLDDPRFVPRLVEQVASFGLSPSLFELEITENCVIGDNARVGRVLGSLREQGFTIALDDFGVGYSSLSHLKGLPLDRIKVDRSFTTRMLEEKPANAIVSATIAMAGSIGIDSVAEGVETTEQARTLRRVGCRFAQGFLYSPALSPQHFAMRWLDPGARRGGAQVPQYEHPQARTG